MEPNNRFQGTLHKVSGPLNRDVGIMKMKISKLIILCLMILACICTNVAGQSTDAPPSATESRAKLDFLDNVPEFHDFDLTMSESDLNGLVTKYNLGVYITPEQGDGDKEYRVWNKDGENVFIGFNAGKCTGIQRMPMEPDIEKEFQQGGPGYPPQGVGSPDP